jgi:hypothetical protein
VGGCVAAEADLGAVLACSNKSCAAGWASAGGCCSVCGSVGCLGSQAVDPSFVLCQAGLRAVLHRAAALAARRAGLFSLVRDAALHAPSQVLGWIFGLRVLEGRDWVWAWRGGSWDCM